jgi:hypothetical protein
VEQFEAQEPEQGEYLIKTRGKRGREEEQEGKSN